MTSVLSEPVSGLWDTQMHEVVIIDSNKAQWRVVSLLYVYYFSN